MKPPIQKFNWNTAVQLFGVNRDFYYGNFQIPGHNGLDIVTSYGDPILAAHDGTIITMSVDNPTKRNGNGLYLLTDDNKYASVYWHLSLFGNDIYVGKRVSEGQVIGFEGNTGFVYPQPTPENQTAGIHLHFAIYDYAKKNNDYYGFIDPVPFLFQKNEKLPIFLDRDLYWGCKDGSDVAHLQTLLIIEKVGFEVDPIGTFGWRTLKAVSNLQKKYNITPTLGYVGPKTKSFLNKKYSRFIS